MKYYLPILCLLFIAIQSSIGQNNKDYKILFDITSKDTADHQTVVRHVSAMGQAYPDARLEVVIYGGAIGMVLKDKSVVGQNIQTITDKNKNISFKVCQSTMKRNNIDKSQLIPGVEVVPDAIIEIVTKQAEGWGYIKEAH
jgi:intracellular sulfur oxidation DsrE/DsrF family protein